MATNKNQHYVPQFYLRNFSLQNNQKTIGVYIKNSSKFVFNAPIKKQVSENYFYGKDSSIDKALQDLETKASNCIQKIIGNDTQLNNDYDCQSLLKLFAAMQSARTKTAGEEVNELTDNTFRKVFEDNPRYKEELEHVRFEYEIPTIVSMQAVARSYPFVSDLKMDLIINNTNIPFITSDHPVVLYNQFMEKKNAPLGNTGLGSKGLQMFLPISPKHLLIFYDNDVYRIGNKYDKAYTTESKSDVKEINKLQVINALEVIFFNEEIKQREILEYKEAGNKYEKNQKVKVEKYRRTNKPNEYLIINSTEDIRCNLDLTFIRIVKKARKYNLSNKAVHLRNEKLFELKRIFMELVKEGKYRSDQFMNFIEKIDFRG